MNPLIVSYIYEKRQICTCCSCCSHLPNVKGNGFNLFHLFMVPDIICLRTLSQTDNVSLSEADLQFITAQDEQSCLSKPANHENRPPTIDQPGCAKLCLIIMTVKQRSLNILYTDSPSPLFGTTKCTWSSPPMEQNKWNNFLSVDVIFQPAKNLAPPGREDLLPWHSQWEEECRAGGNSPAPTYPPPPHPLQ